MQHLPIVGLYAGLNALILAWLTIATGAVRRRCGVQIGDGGDPDLIRVMRGHANAVESIPITLLLLLVAAGMGTPGYVLHLTGGLFTAGRLLHAWHFAGHGPRWARGAGFGLGFLCTLLLAIGLIGHALRAMGQGG